MKSRKTDPESGPLGKRTSPPDAFDRDIAPSSGDPARSEPTAAPGKEQDTLQLEVALYVESISSELRLMARAAGLESLSYFLEMARIEASIQISRRAPDLPEAE